MEKLGDFIVCHKLSRQIHIVMNFCNKFRLQTTLSGDELVKEKLVGL